MHYSMESYAYPYFQERNGLGSQRFREPLSQSGAHLMTFTNNNILRFPKICSSSTWIGISNLCNHYFPLLLREHFLSIVSFQKKMEHSRAQDELARQFPRQCTLLQERISSGSCV